MGAAFEIPKRGGGGPLLSDATEKDLQYWIDRKRADLGEARFPDREREWIAAAEAELRARGVEPAAAPRAANGNGPRPAAAAAQRPQQTAISRAEAPQQVVAGTFNNAQLASQALLEAGRKYHLIAPATVVGRLPEGCEVVVSVVQIDPYGAEVYQITGDRKNPKDTDTVGLDRVALAKIGAAAGVSWLYSRRTDDASHPHYCAWEVMGRFPNFDMSVSDVIGSVEIDTREEGGMRGAAADDVRVKAKNNPYCKDGGDAQMLELRKFLVRHAESKAMNRAIANRGVRRSYKRADLQKPFAVARLIFTGHSDDPEARKDFRQMIGQRFLGATNQLYAAQAQPIAAQLSPAAQAPVAQFLPHSPPPMGIPMDQGYPDDNVVDEQPEAEATPVPKQNAAKPEAVAEAQPELKT